jgi:hypothetical protein
MNDLGNIGLLLSSVSRQLEAVRLARERYAIKLSPGFNCFDYISPDELQLSEIIVDLLNPKGKHSQGAYFLDAFLSRIGLTDWVGLNLLEINTEVTTFNNRRLDIELKWIDRRLVIENKPRAEDQENQIHDYIQDLLKANLKEWHIIYLSGSGNSPSSKSISEKELMERKNNGNISIESYENLIISWINDCRSCCESERFRWFLGEFKSYILAEFKGEHDMQERQSVKEQVLKSEDTIKAAIEISFALQDVKVSLLSQLEKQLRELVLKAGWTLDWDIQYGQRWSGFRIFFFPKDEQYYLLNFQFEKLSLRDLVFGVSKIDDKIADKPAIFELMEKTKFGFARAKQHSWWPWFALVNEEIRDWDNNSQPWIKIKDGTLATDIMKIVQICYDLFKKENKLNLLLK